jgi:hypothetical protein
VVVQTSDSYQHVPRERCSRPAAGDGTGNLGFDSSGGINNSTGTFTEAIEILPNRTKAKQKLIGANKRSNKTILCELFRRLKESILASYWALALQGDEEMVI